MNQDTSPMLGSGLNINNAAAFNTNTIQPTTSTVNKTVEQAGSSGNSGRALTLADGTSMQVAKFNGKSNTNDISKLQTA